MKRLSVSLVFVVFLTGCALGQTDPATNVTDVSATFNGRVSSTENAGQTYSEDHLVEYWFEYGTSTAYGGQTPRRTLEMPEHEFEQEFPVSEPVGELDPGTRYHYRLCADDAQEGVGAGCTGDAAFTTPSDARPSRIAFSSSRSGPFVNWLMDADGGNPVNLSAVGGSTGPDSSPSWSPGADRIVFARTVPPGDAELWTMNANGTGAAQLTDAAPQTIDARPSWSPDGSLIAFDSERGASNNRDIYTIAPNGTGEVNLTNSAGDDLQAAFSPDGRKIAWAKASGSDYDIWVMDADGGNKLNLTDSFETMDQMPAWSPDGRRLVFVSRRDGDDDLFVMHSDGSGQVPLTDTAADEEDPHWSPDGSQIVFGVGFRQEVWVMDADGSDAANITNTPGLDAFPKWSPRIAPTAGGG